MPPATSGIIRLDRRSQLLRAAAELFSANGYATTSIDAIGAQAGVTGPAVYRHFSGKRDLLLTLLGDAVKSVLADIAAATKPDATPLANLEALAREVARHAIAERQVIGLLYAQHGTLAAADRARIDKLRASLLDVWNAAFRAARPDLPEAEAALYVPAALSVVAAITRQAGHGSSEQVYTRLLMGLLTA